MIQRIQSLFLFLTAIVTGLMFFMPVAEIAVPGNNLYQFYTTRVMLAGQQPEFVAWNWMSLLLNAAVTLLALATIFIHKGKAGSVKPALKLQLRLCYANSVLMLGLIALMWVQTAMRSNELQAEWAWKTSIVFPLIGIVLTWIARKHIIKDIATIESLDRIR